MPLIITYTTQKRAKSRIYFCHLVGAENCTELNGINAASKTNTKYVFTYHCVENIVNICI